MEIPIAKLCKIFKCYDSDVDKITLAKTGRRAMASIGMHSKKRDAMAYLRMVPFFLYYHVMTLGQLGHMIQYLQNNAFSFFDVADDFSILLTAQTVMFMFISAGQYAPEYTAMCRLLGDFSRPEVGRVPGVEALDKLYAKYVHGVIYFFMSCILLTWLFYITEDCAPGEVSACGFIFVPYLPYIDIYNTPWRQIWMTYQCIAGYPVGIFGLLMVSQYIFLQEVLILHYDHLEGIVRSIPTAPAKDRKGLIGRIVRYHNFLLRMNKQYNTNASTTYALHLCVTPLNMSVIAYQLLSKEFILMSVTHILTYVVIVTITCGSGERLSTFTANLHRVIFESIPFDDIKTSKMMKLIMLRAEEPLEVRAGGLTACNHVLMIQMYKAVLSTLTFLNKTN